VELLDVVVQDIICVEVAKRLDTLQEKLKGRVETSLSIRRQQPQHHSGRDLGNIEAIMIRKYGDWAIKQV
jgi:hypothetical protein